MQEKLEMTVTERAPMRQPSVDQAVWIGCEV